MQQPELSEYEKTLLRKSVQSDIGLQRATSDYDYRYEISPGDLVTVKLLHSLLETMKEIQDELKHMRKTNERVEKIIQSAITPANTSFQSGDNRKAILVKKV